MTYLPNSISASDPKTEGAGLLTESGFADDGFGGVGGLGRPSLVDRHQTELILVAGDHVGHVTLGGVTLVGGGGGRRVRSAAGLCDITRRIMNSEKLWPMAHNNLNEC